MKRLEERIAELERQVKHLRNWHHEHEANKHLSFIAQRIGNRLFELGPDKVDLELIAELNAALGIDVAPLSKRAPKKVREYVKPRKDAGRAIERAIEERKKSKKP